MRPQIPRKTLTVDFCVIGGGLAGMCAAIAAARRGCKVTLVHDRPVLGGNASSEIRMWVCGAHGDYMRETGIIEEIELENTYRNPWKNYSIWDSVLYEKVRFEPNITLLLNCTCNDAVVNDNRIEYIKAWQLTTQTWYNIYASQFADCSGDSILIPLTGAEYRWGRESRKEFNESLEPEQADEKVMGMSCLIQARETNSAQPFTPPSWAYTYPDADSLPYRGCDVRKSNFWWIELGGDRDTIHDTEAIRDELLKTAFGVWDHIKNHSDNNAQNWILDWIGFLPGKRESRRYVGDHIITQNHVEAAQPFSDTVAYAGWSMDDHHPLGVLHKGEPTQYHPAPSPWFIPLRSLYSKNIENLFCAGRNISSTHIALASSRVMRTCAIIGQAVGTAAHIAIRHTCSPRTVASSHIEEVQQNLLYDDAWLPCIRRKTSSLTESAQISSSHPDAEILRNGIDRPTTLNAHRWESQPGAWVAYEWDTTEHVTEVRLVFDSELRSDFKKMRQRAQYPLDQQPASVETSLVKAFRVETVDENENCSLLHEETNNYQRMAKIAVNRPCKKVRVTCNETWGDHAVKLFSFDVV